MIKPERKSLPSKSGVYIFKDKNNSIIYIGKAKNLKNRVSSYFSQNHAKSPKTQFLVKNISNIEYIITDNEIEALLLENKLIKKHKPKYNISLKDAKTYAYIKITNEEIPKIVTSRKITDNGTYFGPFTDGYLRIQLINLVIKIFKLITNKTYSTKSHLNYDIGIAPARTLREVDKEKYLKNIMEAKKFLLGKNTKKIITNLTNEMLKAKENMQYETALEYKNQIESINHLLEKQKVDQIKNYDQDVIALIKHNSKAIITLFNIKKGVIQGKEDFSFDYDEEILESFIKMYYSQNYIPKEIIINKEFWQNKEEKKIIEEYLSKNKKQKVIISTPQRGEKLSLIKLAIKNAELKIQNKNILEIIKETLKLRTKPTIIECFDISNLGKEHIVAAMTRFYNSKPDTNNYRKFEIKSFKGKNDDFKAMKEVIYRRYKRLKDENKEMPNLIIIDGGKGQLNAALESLKKLKLQLPIISLAKKEEEIFLQNQENPLIIDKNSEMMLFIRNIRDTTHNYVISYNKKKREIKFRKETNS